MFPNELGNARDNGSVLTEIYRMYVAGKCDDAVRSAEELREHILNTRQQSLTDLAILSDLNDFLLEQKWAVAKVEKHLLPIVPQRRSNNVISFNYERGRMIIEVHEWGLVAMVLLAAIAALSQTLPNV